MTPTESQLTRIIYSQWDFQQALSSLTFLLEDCDFDQKYNKVELRRFRCYETTLIISMARPFEQSRSSTTLNHGIVGIRLSPDDKLLVKKVMELRRKIIAHSDEEEMHFRSRTFSVSNGDFKFPHIQFDEGLHLDEPTLGKLEVLLRKLIHDIADFLFRLAQTRPELLHKYKIPARLQDGSTKA